MNRIRAFFSAYADELLHKVTWPRYDELQSNTITVLVASLIIATVVALMDLVFRSGVGAIYGLFE